MSQGFKIVLIENGIQRVVAKTSNYEKALQLKNEWKKNSKETQYYVIQPDNVWSYPNG